MVANPEIESSARRGALRVPSRNLFQGFWRSVPGSGFHSHLQNPFSVHGPHWATELLAILSRIPNPGAYSLPD
jgi:hypothetical protein